MKVGEGKFQINKGKEVFKEFRKEIRIKLRASNGETTVTCVCFTKVACELLNIDASMFVNLEQHEQRAKIKEILYANKLLTLKNQPRDFLLLNVEDLPSIKKK